MIKKDSIMLVRDGHVQAFTARVARHARNNGWVDYVEPAAELGESLTDTKARIKAMTTIEEVNRALLEELNRATPRASVTDLCNKLIAEWK